MTLEELKSGLQEIVEKLKAIGQLVGGTQDFEGFEEEFEEGVRITVTIKIALLFAEYFGVDAETLAKFLNRN
ncbi:MAG: hypothetical protein HYW89_04780 [Candidatus Sungiibacteriota bacterium]|uniref:Uncharacterized protein n=1 Tax=Candidatus Sungiibacteriota bacterium TaxID=2750080 RepID=A0A7T5RJF8_9BACT|nr:MAG: hypothetical protein HYW89_04780 [Candidatus Sungbacteria bacterium]